jgi:hypothetical protein
MTKFITQNPIIVMITCLSFQNRDLGFRGREKNRGATNLKPHTHPGPILTSFGLLFASKFLCLWEFGKNQNMYSS